MSSWYGGTIPTNGIIRWYGGNHKFANNCANSSSANLCELKSSYKYKNTKSLIADVRSSSHTKYLLQTFLRTKILMSAN
jgi:hypothetical protein